MENGKQFLESLQNADGAEKPSIVVRSVRALLGARDTDSGVVLAKRMTMGMKEKGVGRSEHEIEQVEVLLRKFFLDMRMSDRGRGNLLGDNVYSLLAFH